MSACDKNEVYPSKMAKMSKFLHIFSRATLWVDIAIFFIIKEFVREFSLILRNIEKNQWIVDF